MAAHRPAQLSTSPWSVGLPFCLALPHIPALLNTNRDMSDELGVQFMGVRSKVSEELGKRGAND